MPNIIKTPPCILYFGTIKILSAKNTRQVYNTIFLYVFSLSISIKKLGPYVFLIKINKTIGTSALNHVETIKFSLP